MTSNILPIFWDLASSSKDTRIPRSAELISSLEGFQRSYIDGRADKEDSSEDEDDDEDDEEDEDSDAESGIEVDADDDMGETPQDGEAKALDKALDKENADDVVYAVKRLIRGLGSSRDSSRLGFAVALTELLARISSVSPSQAISLLLRSSQTSKANKGQENRDFLFARLFGLTAVVNSGALYSPNSSIDDYRVVTGELVNLGRKKGWLKESAWFTLISAVEGLLACEASWAEEALSEVVDKAYGREAEGGWSSEKVALTLLLEGKRPNMDWKSLLAPTFKHTPLLHSSNLVTLAPILKGSDVEDDEEDSGIASTGAWKPQPHFVWNIILDKYFTSSSSSESAKRAPFQDFFRVIVDESLFANSSSSERKYWGFSIILMSLPLLPAELLPQIFTPNFMRSWINNLSSQDRYLHKAAMQIAQALQGTVKSNPTVGFTLLSQLVGKHGRPDFDKVTKTKLVEAIMSNLSSEGVRDYVTYLQGVVIGKEDNNGSDIKTLQDRRHWALDQLLALCRNNSVPKEDEWVSTVLEFLLLHGFFNVKKADKKGSLSTLHSVPKPPLSEATAAICRARFFSCVLEVTTATTSVKGENTQPKREQGCDQTGKLWLTRLLANLSGLEKDTKHVEPILDADDEIRQMRSSAQKTIGDISKLKGEKGDLATGAEVLLAFLILQTHDESDDALDLLEETQAAVRRLFSLDPSSSTETESLPVDTILDTLIALLDKGSSDLRNFANLVAGLISSAFTKSSIEHLNAQLESTAAESAEIDVDEEHQDDVEDEIDGEDASDGDDDEESEDESEGSADDEDEVMGDVDPAFRARVAAALQVSGMDVEANGDAEDDNEESDEEVWDDEQMLKVDEQLAAVFRDRAAAGSGKKVDKNLQTESIHFKARILDLYEVYAKKQPQNPLVIELLLPLLNITKNSGNAAAALSNKASSLIRSRFAKPKDLPSGIAPSDGKRVLEGIHDMARKTYSAEFTALCSICSVLVARSMDASATSQRSQEVLEVYTKTLDEYMTHKATELHATFLNDYFKRHAVRAWPLHASLLPYLQPGKAVNVYRQTVAYELLSLLAPQLPAIAKTHSAEVDALIPKAVEAFYATLESAKSDEGWKADRLKEFLKSILAFARATKAVGYEWDVEHLDMAKESLTDTRLAKYGSVNSLLQQLRSIASKDKADSKAKAKANGSSQAKRSKKRPNGDVDVDMEVDKDALPPVVPPKKRKESSGATKPSKKVKAPKA